MRRAIALILIALMSTGCSKAIEIPREQFETAAREESGDFRIQMVDGDRYFVKRFAVTDSTVTIVKLNGADYRYRGAKLPIVLSRSEVSVISRLERRDGLSFVVVATVGIFIILFVNLATDPIIIGN